MSVGNHHTSSVVNKYTTIKYNKNIVLLMTYKHEA